MEEILKALKTLPKEYLQVIILELMKDQKISYEDITQAYVQYLDMLRKGQSEAYMELQSQVVYMWFGTKKDRDYSAFLAIIAIWVMMGGIAQCENARELSNIRHELNMMRYK